MGYKGRQLTLFRNETKNNAQIKNVKIYENGQKIASPQNNRLCWRVYLMNSYSVTAPSKRSKKISAFWFSTE